MVKMLTIPAVHECVVLQLEDRNTALCRSIVRHARRMLSVDFSDCMHRQWNAVDALWIFRCFFEVNAMDGPHLFPRDSRSMHSADDDDDDSDDDDAISAAVTWRSSIPAAHSLQLIASALFADSLAHGVARWRSATLRSSTSCYWSQEPCSSCDRVL